MEPEPAAPCGAAGHRPASVKALREGIEDVTGRRVGGVLERWRGKPKCSNASSRREELVEICPFWVKPAMDQRLSSGLARDPRRSTRAVEAGLRVKPQ